MSAGLWLMFAALCAGEPSARWVLTPAEAQIGEPVECRLEIRAPAGSAVLLPEKDPALDPAWVLLEPRRVVRSERGDELALDLSWKLFALEPGTRAPFAFEIPVETSGGRVTLQPAGGELHVRAALAEGEDAPRPQKGFLPPPESSPAHTWIGWTVLGLLVGGAALLLIRGRAAPGPALLPGYLERVALLEREFAADPARAREIVFELTHLVRERVDAARGLSRVSLPDEEWLRAVESDPHSPPAARPPARQLLETAAEVKYGLATPTRFAVEEQLGRARAVLQAFDLRQELAA